ncbi:unnamed protein product [Sphagnum balticum]
MGSIEGFLRFACGNSGSFEFVWKEGGGGGGGGGYISTMAIEESGLEMYCAEDGAWYDGSLSLASENCVRVHFTNFDSDEDEYWEPGTLEDPLKLLQRVRISSEQLQDTQCRTVAKDTLVCGYYEDGDSRKYFDARVVHVEMHVDHIQLIFLQSLLPHLSKQKR